MTNERTFRASDAAKLEDPARLVYLSPEEAAAQVGLREGMRVADVGAGTGFFAIPFARRVGAGGRVFAVDMQPEMLELLRAKLNDEERARIDLVEGSATRTGLNDGSCDLVWMAKVWHELDECETVLAEAARVLREKGRIAILDWRPGASRPPGPPEEHRVAAADVVSMLTREGWQVERASDFSSYSYLVVAGAPGVAV
jgi:ubiquinone/menaquinone biosynthesis C-methylase UbiE